MSITDGAFFFVTKKCLIPSMQTVFETRRQRLRLLIKKHGTIAALARAIAVPEISEIRLSQVQNKSMRKDRGTFYEMGDATARRIEEQLKLPEGWFDTPITYAELHGEEDPISKAMMVMERMPESDRYKVVRLLDAFIEQPANPLKTGTLG